MSQIDIDELFRKFTILDAELKELRKEVGEMKWYAQHGTTGAVAYSAGQVYTESSEHQPGKARPFISLTEEDWRESFK